jgi:hypothetical protein
MEENQIFKWQDISAFGKILDGVIRGIEIPPESVYIFTNILSIRR